MIDVLFKENKYKLTYHLLEIRYPIERCSKLSFASMLQVFFLKRLKVECLANLVESICQSSTELRLVLVRRGLQRSVSNFVEIDPFYNSGNIYMCSNVYIYGLFIVWISRCKVFILNVHYFSFIFAAFIKACTFHLHRQILLMCISHESHSREVNLKRAYVRHDTHMTNISYSLFSYTSRWHINVQSIFIWKNAYKIKYIDIQNHNHQKKQQQKMLSCDKKFMWNRFHV